MGLGLLSALGGAADYESKEIRSDKDLNDWKTKQQFTEQLEEQLAQKRAQIAQQYPTYSHFVTNPLDNSTTGFTTQGGAQKLSEGDPVLKDLRTRDLEAQASQRGAQAERDKAAASMDEAHGALYADRTANPSKYFRPTSAGASKPISEGEYLRQYNAWRKANGKWGTALPDTAENQAAFKSYVGNMAGDRAGLLGTDSAPSNPYGHLIPGATASTPDDSGDE